MALGLLSRALQAEEAAATATAAAAPTVNTGDTAWLLTATALVLFMTPGLAFFYAGMVRTKNAVATAMQSFIAIPVVTIVWFVCGYSIAFGPGSAYLGGMDWAFFNNVGGAPHAGYGATVPHLLFALFQLMFAIITPALITGAFAERMKFKTYLAFTALWSLVVYSPVCHWAWGLGGFLRDGGLLDFAGGTVVHQTAGFSAIVAALLMGRRRENPAVQPHNVLFILAGTAMLWFGWFGFNAGSAIASGELSVFAFGNTHLAACVAAFAWMLMDWAIKGKPSLTGACIGAVAGLVAITPASGFVSMKSAFIIGAVAGIVCNYVAVLRGKSQLDDTLDVFACHGVGGLIGTCLTGLLAEKAINAAGADGSVGLMFSQLKSSLIIIVFSMVATFVIMKVLDLVMGLRPSPEQEAKGLDIVEHDEQAYRA